MDFSVPTELQQLTSVIRQFVDREVEPIWRQIEETNQVPVEVLHRAAEIGLFGFNIPEEYGGLGLDMVGKALVYEELGRTHAGFATIVGLHNGIGTTTIVQLGSERLKWHYLTRMATGEWVGAFALTEPGAGSDAAAISTRAERRGDRWVLNGTKHFITNAHIARIFTVYAVTDTSKGPKGISAFLVERDTPGFSIGREQPTMGLRGSHTAELLFRDCELPAENLLGEEGQGYSAALRNLAQGRIGLAARCVGASARVTELATRYAARREQFGRPIAEFQLVQAHLAEMAAETAAARALMRQTAWMLDRGDPVRKEAAMTKLVCSETYGRVVDRAVQVYGGMGYCADSPVEHYYRDARITRIYEGTSEIQKLIIARELLKELG